MKNETATIDLDALLNPAPTTKAEPELQEPAPGSIMAITAERFNSSGMTAEARNWAQVHASSLKPDRWYKIPDSDNKWRYVAETARIMETAGTCSVVASFEVPNPEGDPELCTAVARPDCPFIEVPPDLTKNGNKKSSNERKTSATIIARCTPEEKAAIITAASAKGLNVSQAIRRGLCELLSLSLDDDPE